MGKGVLHRGEEGHVDELQRDHWEGEGSRREKTREGESEEKIGVKIAQKGRGAKN